MLTIISKLNHNKARNIPGVYSEFRGQLHSLTLHAHTHTHTHYTHTTHTHTHYTHIHMH